MSTLATFSPDATLAGPIVHVLRGVAAMKKPCQIQKGETLYYKRDRTTGAAEFTFTATPTAPLGSKKIAVIPAEAVVVHNSDHEISVPVVVAGRAEYVLTPKGSGSFGAGLPLSSENDNFRAHTIHPESFIENREKNVEVFIEHFGSPPSCD